MKMATTFAPSKTQNNTTNYNSNTPKSNMKKLLSILPAIAIALISVSCSNKEDVAAEAKGNTNAAFFASNGIHRPALQCGTSQFSDLVSTTSGITAGNVEIVNDRNNVYLLFTMADDLVLSDLSIFYGNIADLPVSSDGSSIQSEAFANTLSDAGNSTLFTYSMPFSEAISCNSLVLKATVQHMDFMGNVWGAETVWLDGATVVDGLAFNHCVDVCPPAATSMVSGAE